MSPWKTLVNNYFWLTYNNVQKNYSLKFLWKDRITEFGFKFTKLKYNLIKDEK